MTKTAYAILLSLALFCVGCGAWFPIAYQNAEALRLDGDMYRDVHILTASKSAAQAYDIAKYAAIEADVTNAEGVYKAIPKSGLSLAQLQILRDELQIFKTRDSVGASPAFFQIAGPRLDSTAATIIDLERSKLLH